MALRARAGAGPGRAGGRLTAGSAAAVQEVLAALADPTRRELLERISRHGEATATRLAAELPISRQAVVQHLAVLDSVGLVAGRRAGRERRYGVRPERLAETAEWMAALAAQWGARLDAIRRIAETPPGPGEGSEPAGTPAEPVPGHPPLRVLE